MLITFWNLTLTFSHRCRHIHFCSAVTKVKQGTMAKETANGHSETAVKADKKDKAAKKVIPPATCTAACTHLR
jgi:hypothetical protein